MKRAVDLVGSLAAIVLCGPLLLLLGPLMFLLDPGPLIFKQKRLGQFGREFNIYKFRTMVVDAEEILKKDPNLYAAYRSNNFSLNVNTDPRVTRIGRFLRKTSLDELPQFFNVFKGEMSLVGPRPIVPEELAHYEHRENAFLSIRPGITGYWQACGRSEIQYPERAEMEMYYVENHNLWFDIKILCKTIMVVLFRRGAF